MNDFSSKSDFIYPWIRDNQFSEICSSSWSISSIADLLVLIICCPNAMVEMYMRRVRWKLFFFRKRISQICWHRIFGWWERLCASWFPLLVKKFLESKNLDFVPCFHPELTVSHTSVLTILAITVERYYAVGFRDFIVARGYFLIVPFFPTKMKTMCSANEKPFYIKDFLKK